MKLAIEILLGLNKKLMVKSLWRRMRRFNEYHYFSGYTYFFKYIIQIKGVFCYTK